jgi:hypothetical protein
MPRVPLGNSAIVGVDLVLASGHHLGDNDQDKDRQADDDRGNDRQLNSGGTRVTLLSSRLKSTDPGTEHNPQELGLVVKRATRHLSLPAVCSTIGRVI